MVGLQPGSSGCPVVFNWESVGRDSFRTKLSARHEILSVLYPTDRQQMTTKKSVTGETIGLLLVYAVILTVCRFWDRLTLDNVLVSSWTLTVIYGVRYWRQRQS